jgi:hypothetical protein
MVRQHPFQWYIFEPFFHSDSNGKRKAPSGRSLPNPEGDRR